MTERSEVTNIEANDKQAYTAKAKDLLDGIATIAPENLRCAMSVFVDNEGRVRVGILGSDMDITKMFSTLASVAHNGVLQANTPSNPSNETAH
jgi:hypothetical protein